MNGCLQALAVLFGLVLILPGLCTVFFGGTFMLSTGSDGGGDYGLGGLGIGMVVGGLAVAAVGIYVIWLVFRRPR